jgi:hypothetical protein
LPTGRRLATRYQSLSSICTSSQVNAPSQFITAPITVYRNIKDPVQTAFNVPIPRKGLSRGAIAGIAVGSVLAALLVLAGIAFFFWRKREARKQNEAVGKEAPGEGFVKAELPADDSAKAKVAGELEGITPEPVMELDGVNVLNKYPVELPI